MAQGKKNNIDGEQVAKLAERFWTKTEIAAFFNVSERTIRDNFADIFIKGRELGKAKLRDYQLKSVAKGNVTMQIWLGKQYLGQTDQPQELNDNSETTVIFKERE